MEICTGFVLKLSEYSDTLKIIHFYSREKGYISMIAPTSIFKRRNKPVHLFQIVEIEYSVNNHGGLHHLKSADTIKNLPNLYFDVIKMNILLLWGEVLNLILKNEEPNDALYNFIINSIEYLNTSEEDTGNFNLFFLYRLSTFLGLRINTDSWQEDYLFSIADGCFYPADRNSGCISGPNTARTIHRICTCLTEELSNIPLNQSARNILIDIIFIFYERHLNIHFNTKSIQVIREIFK